MKKIQIAMLFPSVLVCSIVSAETPVSAGSSAIGVNGAFTRTNTSGTVGSGIGATSIDSTNSDINVSLFYSKYLTIT
jgi:hypothetical protein